MAPTEQVTTARTLTELLDQRARGLPDAVGYTFLADGEAAQDRMSYAELQRRAGRIAGLLRGAGAEPGQRALLLLAPGLDYVAAFFGCLYAGVVAVPAYPPDPFRVERTLPRLLSVVGDADPVLALTTSDLSGFVASLGEHAPRLRQLRWIAVDAASPEVAQGFGEVGVDPEGVDPEGVDPHATAFLQYTSGSTAAPRGVMVSHANLLHNLRMIRDRFGTDTRTRALIWLPPYHDMGLIGGILQPLYSGCPVTLLSPLHFLEQPLRWLRHISTLGVNVSGGPNFAYELCARRATPADVASLDLSSWQVAFNGAEPIRPETLDRFAAVFGPAGFAAEAFLPCYGLAEATLIVSGAVPGEPSPRLRVDRDALARGVVAPPGPGSRTELVTCGTGASDQQIAIVDARTRQRCSEGIVGEVWVSGPSVARGYWGRPEETERVFGARIAGEDAAFLRTGDLGFQVEGRLVVTGRAKDLLIVRGRNHYPHDLELTAEQAHPALRVGCSAAFQVPGAGAEDRVVVVMEVRGSPGALDADLVAARVREAVALAHGVRVHQVALIPANTIPKTSSGKIQRSMTRARFLADDLPGLVQAQLGRPEPPAATAADAVLDAGPRQRLRALVADLLGVEPDRLDAEVPLLGLGLDSLAVVTLQHRVETEFGVVVPLGDLLAGATLGAVGERIAAAGTPPRPSGPSRPALIASAEPEFPPLPHGVREIWMMQQLDPDSPEFTLATALRLPESVDLPALQAALDVVVRRHPALRTTFEVRGEEPVQVVHPERRIRIEEHDLPRLDEDGLARYLGAVAQTPLDLATGPLLRVGLYRCAAGEVLMVRMHHIVTDFWSSTILAREVGALYTARVEGRELELAPPRAGFPDVTAWRRSVLGDSARVEALERFWLAQLTTPEARWPRLALPRVAGRGGPAGTVDFDLTGALTSAVRRRAAAERITPYMLELAAFVAALCHTTGQRDVVVGTSTAGRTRPEFADVVGCCTGTSLIRCRTADDEPFAALLERVSRHVVGGLQHQDYPMALLRGRHGIDGRGHLADVLFTVNHSPPRPAGGDLAGAEDAAGDLCALAQVGAAGARGRWGSLPVEKFALPDRHGGAVPLEVVIAEVSGVAHGRLRYRADALDREAADRLVRRFLGILDRVAHDPQATLAELGASPREARMADPPVPLRPERAGKV